MFSIFITDLLSLFYYQQLPLCQQTPSSSTITESAHDLYIQQEYAGSARQFLHR